ncbi:MAG: hypothetical protein SCK28_02415 [Bacillota bacterium]|nr:hypothetical protein [Bacillota bacterium]
MKNQPSIDKLFYPASIAVINESKETDICDTMSIKLSKFFTGELHQAASIAEIPNPIDVVIFNGSESYFKQIYQESSAKGVSHIILLSSFNNEVIGELKSSTKGWLPKVCGGLSCGIANYWWGSIMLTDYFLDRVRHDGSNGLISVNDELSRKVLQIAKGKSLGFNLIASLGFEADLKVNEVINYYIAAPEVKRVYLVFNKDISLEQLKENVEAAVAITKPMIVLKASWTFEERLLLEKKRIICVSDPWEMVSKGKALELEYYLNQELGVICSDKTLSLMVVDRLTKIIEPSLLDVWEQPPEDKAGLVRIDKYLTTTKAHKILIVWQGEQQILNKIIDDCKYHNKEVLLVTSEEYNKASKLFYFDDISNVCKALWFSQHWHGELALDNSQSRNSYYAKSRFIALSQLSCVFDDKSDFDITEEKVVEILKLYNIDLISQDRLTSYHMFEPEKTVEFPFRFNINISFNVNLGPVLVLELIGINGKPIKSSSTIAPVTRYEIWRLIVDLGIINELEIIDNADQLINLLMNITQFAIDVEQYISQIEFNSIRIFPELKGLMVSSLHMGRRF